MRYDERVIGLRARGWGNILAFVGFLSAIVLSPALAQAQIIEIPECGVDLPPDDPFCELLCDIDPSEPWCVIPAAAPVVLFIPGLQGSRLLGAGEQLWEPANDSDVQELFLNEQGESVRSDIQTGEIIDEAFGYNIYKTFIQFMDELVADGTLVAWQAVPYDWRFDGEDHVPALVGEIADVTHQSPGSPVTIIAHSNGGLLAKGLIDELERQKSAGESDLIDSIDRLILVAVPQVGTPKTIPSLLHGFDLDYAKGALLNSAVARVLAQYMPSAFNLLPAPDYFAAVADPVIEFDPSVDRLVPWRTLYGPSIDTPEELHSFLTGGNGAWRQPNLNDTVSPVVLQEHFLAAAAENHDAWTDWHAPAGIDVVQIAGWGLDTVKTVRYMAKRVFSCGDVSPTFCRDRYILDYEPVFTEDGDQTVVTPSAALMDGSEYYLDLKSHNQELVFNLRRNRDHADIFEVASLQQFIRNIFIADSDLPEHITATKPEPTSVDKRLRVSVHSPVSLRVCSEVLDDSGQPLCTGVESIPGSDIRRKVEDLPNSYYMEFGEGKYMGFSADEPHTIHLEGQEPGTFTLEVEEVVGATVVDSLVYENIPVVTGEEVSLTLETVANAGDLKLDYEGDGRVDTIIKPGAQLTPRQLLELLLARLRQLRLKHGEETKIRVHILNVIKFLSRVHHNRQPIDSQLTNIVKTIEKERGRSVSSEDVAHIIEIIDMIKSRL